MKDWLDILKEFGFQVAPWMIAVVLILYILRERLSRGLNALLDWLGTIFRGEWSYRRFESVFRYLLEHTLDRVRKNGLTLIELIPALVNLLAIEKSPFANQVMDFVEVYFRRLDREARLQLMTTIGGTATREAARLLLYLYPTLPDEGLNILKELVLIGSVAVEEALQWNRRGDLSNTKLEELLLRSYVPEATQALWERDGLEPEVKTEAMRLEWA
jgi:hypothetical protein